MAAGLESSAPAGRTAVITGTGGLGFEAALSLARHGFAIVLAGRNAAKGAEAIASLRTQVPGAEARLELVDLASLASVRELAERLLARGEGIDVLINNAGVMSPPQRKLTADGYELQFGVNYLAHFALTARLLPLLGTGSRVVNVTSLAQHYGKLKLDNLQSERSYNPGVSYCASKLLQAIFTVELQRRSEAHGWGITSLAAHPGFAATNLFEENKGSFSNTIATRVIAPLLGQSAARGALSLVHAAQAPDVVGGALYGPTGFLQMKGPPGERRYAAAVKDRDLAARLWDISEDLAGVSFPK